MTNGEYQKLKSQIAVLKELSPDYGGKLLDHVIRCLTSRVEEAEKEMAFFHKMLVVYALDAVCEVFGVTQTDLTSASRKQHLVFAREVLSGFLKGKKFSDTDIGKAIDRDRTTVVYIVRKFNEDVKYDRDFRANYNAVEALAMNKFYAVGKA